jgi:beta-galactosidase
MLFQLYNPDNSPVFEEPIDATYGGNDLIKDAHFRSNLISFHVEVPGNASAWSDETPTLYRLEATLVRIDPSHHTPTSTIDVFECKVGFRSVEISNRELLINGKAVLIKGVNRHDHSQTGGKAVTLEEIRQDLMLMKEYNFNAVRTAHYPNDPYLYDLADELGLYVVDEANIECHGHYDMICREHSYAASMLDRVQRLVIRDQNHPSIIGWSLGNEAGFGANQTMLYGWIKGYDSSRFVQYEGANRPVWGQLQHTYEREDSTMATDVVCPMYPTIDEMVKWADSIFTRPNRAQRIQAASFETGIDGEPRVEW